MPKRLTIEDVKNFIKENDINHDCELISTEYINLKIPLKFKCNCCGATFFKDFGHMKQRKKFKCQTCSRRESQSLSITDVKKFIESNDKEHLCNLISTQYINNNTPLEFKCNKCGQIFFRDYQHLIRDGGRFQCPQCGIEQGAKSKIYSAEDVKKKIKEKGYELIGEYINAATPFKVRCEKGHELNLIFSYFLKGHSGCKKCANENLKGENHWNWKGGESEILNYLRKSIKSWKKEILIRDNFRCVLTNDSKDLIIHHLKSFNTIIIEASNNTGVPILQKISEYERREDLDILREEVIKLHTKEIGITLNREVHNKFHEIYGKGNNTPEQFNEFKNNFKFIDRGK